METKERIGLKVRELRKSKRITQDFLAQKIGINRRHLSRLESGKSYPSIQLLEKIADYFEIEIKDFFID